MIQESFPNRGPGGEEPLPAGGEVPEGLGHGLFVCLPAEELTLEGFAQNGRSDTMAPGALLATVLDAVVGEGGSGLAALADDQLIGIISAARRMESRTAWTLLAALAELARRRPAEEPGDDGEYGFSEFAADEVAADLHLTRQSATEQIWYARQVAGQLPRCFAALAAGQIHPVHLRIIADETALLSDDDRARADELLAGVAGPLTFGQLRSKAHRLVLRLDPDAARKRKEQARQDARVCRFRENSGNAGMEARELPPDEVLASWQHVEQRALDLRAAGMSGPLADLRVRAYLDLLQERDSRLLPAGPGAEESGHADWTGGAEGPGRAGQEDRPPGPGGDGPSDQDDGPGDPPDPGDPPGGTGGPGPGPGGAPGGTGPGGHPHGPGSHPRARPGAGPSVAALVNILVPAETLLGLSATPGEAAGYGLLDADDIRDLVGAAARHPNTRWCITAVHPDGTAAAHGCARGRHPPPGTPTGPDPPPGTPTGPDPSPSTAVQDYLTSLRIRIAPIARGHCDHTRAETGYQPSRALQHLVKVRNTRCTAPGCGQPASRCDLDHTVAWDQGGFTCECDLAPLCRHHHRCKQSQGWKLEQPSPGVLRWRTPAGRRYTTTPTTYPL